MNNQDREHLNRIESKIDLIEERGIRTEEKVTAHLQHHDNRVKYGIGIVGIVVTIAIAGFKYLKDIIKGWLS